MDNLYEIDRRRGGFMNTYQRRGKDADVVIVPWKLFAAVAGVLNWPFHRGKLGEMEYNDDKISVMFSAEGLAKPSSGHLNHFLQTWIMNVTDVEGLHALKTRLITLPTVLGITLDVRSLFPDKIEVPLVIFLNPGMMAAMEDLNKGFTNAEDALRENRKFSIELDFSHLVSRWAKSVLGRTFQCSGGKLCITNGKPFNHIFDWQNLVGCMWCLPCCMVTNPIYRINRKTKYTEDIITVQDYTAVAWGGVSDQSDDQLQALQNLVGLCTNERLVGKQLKAVYKTKKDPIKGKVKKGKTRTGVHKFQYDVTKTSAEPSLPNQDLVPETKTTSFITPEIKLPTPEETEPLSNKEVVAASQNDLHDSSSVSSLGKTTFDTKFNDSPNTIRIILNGEEVQSSGLFPINKATMLLPDVDSSSMSSLDSMDLVHFYASDKTKKKKLRGKRLMAQRQAESSPKPHQRGLPTLHV